MNRAQTFRLDRVRRDVIPKSVSSENFEKIQDIVVGPIIGLASHHATVKAALKRIKDNIIGFMYLDE